MEAKRDRSCGSKGTFPGRANTARENGGKKLYLTQKRGNPSSGLKKISAYFDFLTIPIRKFISLRQDAVVIYLKETRYMEASAWWEL